MNAMQEQICAGCEFYEDSYKKALDRFLLYKEKIMCTQTLIQKYERRKDHNQQLLRKLQKSRQNVSAVRERFMHYMERYMPLEKSYNELRAAHNDLEDKMHTQSTSLTALQQHNKQLSALIEVQEKDINEYKEKNEKLEEELKKKLKNNNMGKVKADDKHRNMLKSAVELAILLKDKGMLPDSYKLCLRSWKKQLSQDTKPENVCVNGGHSPDKASSISSLDTGFDSSKSMSDDEHSFDENVRRTKGAVDDKGSNNALKSASPSIPLETSISDQSVNTSNIVRNSSISRATQSFPNLRDIGVNTSVSMFTSDSNKFLHEVILSDCKNSEQLPCEQGMVDYNFKPLYFDKDLQMRHPDFNKQASIFSPVKGAAHSAIDEMPPTNAEKLPASVEMSPSNDSVEEYQSKFVQSEKLVFTNADPSKTIPPHLKDTCTKGKSLSVIFASDVSNFGKGQSVHEEEIRGGVRGGKEEEEEELEEEGEELRLGVGGEGEEEEEEVEEECYDDGRNDGANNISSPDHDKGRNLHAGREDVPNELNPRMQTALCFKDPSRGSHTDESRVSHILQEMKLFAPRLISPMSPCSEEMPTNHEVGSVSSEMSSENFKTSVLPSVKYDSFEADFGVSQTVSYNNSVFQQQSVQAGDTKKRNLTLQGKRSSSQKKSVSNKTHDPAAEGTNQDCKIEFEPLKIVCQNDCSSKYNSVLARFSIGKDVSSTHHTSIKTKITNSTNISPDPKYTNFFTRDFVKSLNHLTSIIRSKKFLKYTKKNNCQGSRKLRKKILKTVDSPKKYFAANKPYSSYRNIVKTASGCFLETANDSPISVCSVLSTPKSCKFEERLTLPEAVNCHLEEPNAVMKVSERKRKISPLECNTDMLASKKQQKKGRSHLRLMGSWEVEKSRKLAERNILRHEAHTLTHITQKQVEHKESFMSDIVAHEFEPEEDNQTVKSSEKDTQDTENIVMTLNPTYNYEETVNNSKCSLDIPDTVLLPTNNNSTELKRKNMDTVSCSGYKGLLDDLNVSDDNSSLESNNANNELSHCVEAEGSDDEFVSDSEVSSNNFSKTDVPQNFTTNGTKCELLKVNHDITGSEKSCSSESIEEVPEHSSVRYFTPQIVKDNESVVKYEEMETEIPTECIQEICVANQSVDLLNQQSDTESEVQERNLTSEVGESISEIPSSLSALCNTDGRTINNVETPCGHLNNGSDANTSEVTTVNEKELEMNSVSSSKMSTHSLAQPDITADCASPSSVCANSEDCTIGSSDVLNVCNTKTFIQSSEVNSDKHVAKQGSLSPNDCVGKKIDSADNMYNVDSELSKYFTEKHKCTNENINQCESQMAKKGHKHTKEQHCSDNNSPDICKDENDTELLKVKHGLQNGAGEDAVGDHNKNCNIDINGKSERELEEIAHPNDQLQEDVFTRKCGRSVIENCNIEKSLINGSRSEEPIIKEQHESNRDDTPVEKTPQTKLSISKQEGKDTSEAYCEEYYMPPRTKKRIAHQPKPQAAHKPKPQAAHKPKPQASGTEICSEDKNFKSPIKAVIKQTPRKTKPKTDDELKNIKSVNQGLQSSSSNNHVHTVNEIGGGLQSLPLNATPSNMKEKCTLEPSCSSSEVTENVNFVSETKKLETEGESGTDALVNSPQKKQLQLARLDDKQLEPSSTNLQVARRSDRLKKNGSLKLWQIYGIRGPNRRLKLKDEKCSTAGSVQGMVSIKAENCDVGPSSTDMDNVKKEKCDTDKALLAGEPVTTVENSKVEKLHRLEDDIDVGPTRPLMGGNKRKIKRETEGKSNGKKLVPHLLKKAPYYQTEFENEAKIPVLSSALEDKTQVSCKLENQFLCLAPSVSDKNICKEECADGNTASTASQEHNKCGSVTSSEFRTSLEETRSTNDTGHSNGENIYLHINSESDPTLKSTNVTYAKGDIIRKCLKIQHRNKLTAKRPTRKILNEQEVFLSHQLSELLEGDFTNEVLNIALEKFGQDDTPVDAVILVRCILKILLQEDCNEIDRSHEVRAPPLSVVEEKLITLMITLRNRYSRFSTIINDFLTAVEYYVLNFRTTPEYDVLHILTRFHTALCKTEGLRERAQAFCYDALYCLKRKCFPIIYTVLIYYPEVFPRASLGMTSPVCVCIVHCIFTAMSDANNIYLRIKPLITLLCRIYDYKVDEVLSCDLADCFLKHLKCQTSKAGEVCAAVTLLAKRKDRSWTLTQLIPKYIAPILHDWRDGKINDAVISSVIDLIGCVIKPFTEEADLRPVMNIFKVILNTDKVTQTLKMKAALNVARQASQHFADVAPILYEWVPEGTLPNEFWKQMSDILSVKPYSFWKTFLSTYVENTEEMCVDFLIS